VRRMWWHPVVRSGEMRRGIGARKRTAPIRGICKRVCFDGFRTA
jgi:hypothetical protein